jgi:hypothetical protein
MEDVKMFLFARWVCVNYGSVLNTKKGDWYKEQIKHFNNFVYPNYIKNGTVKETKLFFNVL